MANIIQKRKTLDGSVVAFHFYLESDGVTGELVDYTLIDPTIDLDPPMAPGRDLTIERIYAELQGFSAKLAFDGGANGQWVAWVVGPGLAIKRDFKPISGIPDKSGGSGGPTASGKLRITTTGFLQASARGSLILQLHRAR